MKKYNLKTHQWEEVQNPQITMKYRWIHAMPTCGKSAFVSSASRIGNDWLDTDDLITGIYTWDVWDFSRDIPESHNSVCKGACFTASLIQMSTGCNVITNLTKATPDVSFGRSAELLRKMYEERSIAKHGPIDSWDADRKQKFDARMAEISGWVRGWEENLKKWNCPAFMLDEGEYLCSAFGLKPDTSLNPKTYAVLNRIQLTLDKKAMRNNVINFIKHD